MLGCISHVSILEWRIISYGYSTIDMRLLCALCIIILLIIHPCEGVAAEGERTR